MPAIEERNEHGFMQLSRPVIAVAYLVVYLCLDWAIYVREVSPLGITPWNPSAGLALSSLLWMGLGFLPVVAAGLLLSDILVRHVPIPWWIEATEICVVICANVAAVWLLTRPALRFERSLTTMRDLLLLVLAGISSSAVVAVVYVGVLAVSEVLPHGILVSSILRHWGGDLIGIMAVAPALLMVADPVRRPRPSLAILLEAGAILVAVMLVLGSGAALRQQLFYLLFLPIGWIAVQSGLPGASAGLLVMQIALLTGVHALPATSIEVESLQAVLLVLAFSAVTIGLLTDQRRQAEARLRQQQEALARAARIAGMGSMSSSIAHEINQPLTAVTNYARAAQAALSADAPRIEDAKAYLAKTVGQVERASEVVRKLRGLMEGGRAELVPVLASSLVHESLDVMRPELLAAGVEINVDMQPADMVVMADRVQIELVLVNLLRNSLEAITAAGGFQRRIEVRVIMVPSGAAAFEVADSGPGFSRDFDIDQHGPGQTDKRHGLGMGLTLARSIIEAHGGRLSIERPFAGAAVRFTLQLNQGEQHV